MIRLRPKTVDRPTRNLAATAEHDSAWSWYQRDRHLTATIPEKTGERMPARREVEAEGMFLSLPTGANASPHSVVPQINKFVQRHADGHRNASAVSPPPDRSRPTTLEWRDVNRCLCTEPHR